MANIFISYSRADTPFVEDFVPLLKQVFSDHEIWFDEHITGGEDWWRRILDEIRHCDLFIYLLSNDSLASEYCQAEFREALRLQKLCLPVIVRSKTDISIAPEDLAPELRRREWVDLSSGLQDYRASAKLYAAINNQLTNLPQSPPAPLSHEHVSKPDVPSAPARSNRWLTRTRVAILILAIALAGTLGRVILGELSTTATEDPLQADTPVTQTGTPISTPSPTPPTRSATDFMAEGKQSAGEGNLDAALEAYTRAIELERNNVDAHIQRSLIYLAQGNTDQAMRDAEHVIELDPRGYISRSTVYRESGDPRQALADADEAVRLNEHNADAYINRAYTHLQLFSLELAGNNPDEAMRYLELALEDANRAVELDPNNAEAYEVLAEIHRTRGDPQAALEAYSNIIELNPEHHGAYEMRGEMYEVVGCLNEALENYQNALALRGKDDPMSARIEALQAHMETLRSGGDLTILVPARVDWIGCGIHLRMGDEFRIEANGTINFWVNCEEQKADVGRTEFDCNQAMVGPEGSMVRAIDVLGTDAGHPLPNERMGALLGRIGDGEPFMVGEGGIFPARTDGPLQFRVNDDNLADNDGEFTVTIAFR